jgi:SAM-dependent methyltransferase
MPGPSRRLPRRQTRPDPLPEPRLHRLRRRRTSQLRHNNFQQWNLGGEVDLREGDAEHLPFDDASFDTVVCALSLCTVPSPVTALGERIHAVKPA